MRYFIKKSYSKKKLLSRSAISKNLSSGVRDLQKLRTASLNDKFVDVFSLNYLNISISNKYGSPESCVFILRHSTYFKRIAMRFMIKIINFSYV